MFLCLKMLHFLSLQYVKTKTRQVLDGGSVVVDSLFTVAVDCLLLLPLFVGFVFGPCFIMQYHVYVLVSQSCR